MILTDTVDRASRLTNKKLSVQARARSARTAGVKVQAWHALPAAVAEGDRFACSNRTKPFSYLDHIQYI